MYIYTFNLFLDWYIRESRLYGYITWYLSHRACKKCIFGSFPGGNSITCDVVIPGNLPSDRYTCWPASESQRDPAFPVMLSFSQRQPDHFIIPAKPSRICPKVGHRTYECRLAGESPIALLLTWPCHQHAKSHRRGQPHISMDLAWILWLDA